MRAPPPRHLFRCHGLRRQDLIFALLQQHSVNRGEVYGDGVLETLPDEGGRVTVVCRDEAGRQQAMLPAPWNARRRRLHGRRHGHSLAHITV